MDSDAKFDASASGENPEVSRFLRSKEIFIAVRELRGIEREDAVERLCNSDNELRHMVHKLLRGDAKPLPVESLADDIRAAQSTTIGSMALDSVKTVAAAQELSDLDGSRIGRYKLLERIGEGGFGVVFTAEQIEPVRRRVAIKIIKLGMDTRQVIARFEAERQALAMMDHRCIAKVLDGGSTATGRPYFVMELVKGLPITEYCDQHRLGLRERLELVVQVCDALQHAHQRGIIHRDVKPSNVLVTEVDGVASPKVIDFGIAKATTGRLTERTIYTEMRQMIGTPAYMSPEQAGQSDQDVDTRTDVYAVGVLLYELLTGATPFDLSRLASAAYGEVQRIIREEDPPRPSTRLTSKPQTIIDVAQRRGTAPAKLAPAIRGDLDWIVMKAMEKDRKRRYDSAGSFGADIGRYLTGHPVDAAPPGKAYLISKFVRRNRGAVFAASLIALALCIGLVGTTLGFFNAQKQRELAVTQRSLAEDEKARADENAAQAFAAEALATRRAYSANMMSASNAVAGVQFNTARTFLDAAPERLRGWEWGVLDAKLDTSIRTLAIKAKPTGGEAGELMLHPDGKSVFTINWFADPVAQRWDIETGHLLQSFSPPFQPVGAENSRAYLSPNGRNVTFAPEYVSDGSKGIFVDSWDLSTGERVSRYEIAGSTRAAARSFPSADATRIFVYSKQRIKSVRTTKGDGNESLAEHPLDDEHFPLAVNHGDTMIAEGRASAPYGLVLRDAHSLKPLFTFAGHGLMQAACFSRDDRWLGVTAKVDTARIWDLAANPPTFITLQHQYPVHNIRFSPDASLVATIAIDRAIRIWDRASGRLLGTYPSESLDPFMLMFLPDGKTVAGWEADGTLRFWDITAEKTSLLRGHKSIVSDAKFASGNPAGIIVSSSWEGIEGSTGTLRLWDADSGDMVGVHHGEQGDIAVSMAISTDGRFAAIAISNKFGMDKAQGGLKDEPVGRTEVLDLTTGKLVFATPTFRNSQWIAVTGDNRSVVVADVSPAFGLKYQLHLLDARTGALMRTKELDPKSGWVFARSPDGQTIAALPLARGVGAVDADLPGTMLFLDANTLETVRTIDGIPEQQMSMAFSHDGTRIATGGVDGILRVFDAHTGEALATMSGQGLEILNIAFSPDGGRIASAGMDRKISLWDAKTFEPVAAFTGHLGHISDLDWDRTRTTPASLRLVSSSGDNTVRIWDPSSLQTRTQALEARKDALKAITPLVQRLFTQLRDPAKVLEAINTQSGLSALERKVALQEILRLGLEKLTLRKAS
jgi:WD40 repeat protein